MEPIAGIPVLYQDEALLAVNKPAGLSTLPDGYDPSLPHVKSLLEAQAGRLWTVHRLDKDTSGVLLFARSASAHRSLNTQFETHQVSKVYHAIVWGDPDWQRQSVDLPLRPNGDRRHRTVIDHQAGKPALTHFNLLERFETACLLEARPETGRTHQIRAHLYYLGLSIMGDRLYVTSYVNASPNGKSHTVWVGGETLPHLSGMALHACALGVFHPLTGERMIFEATYPAGWENLLHQLRHSATHSKTP